MYVFFFFAGFKLYMQLTYKLPVCSRTSKMELDIRGHPMLSASSSFEVGAPIGEVAEDGSVSVFSRYDFYVW